MPVHLLVPETPLHLTACAADVQSVGLGQTPGAAERRLFVWFTPPDEPEQGALARGAIVHVSIDNARFLRAALDTVLQQHDALQQHAN